MLALCSTARVLLAQDSTSAPKLAWYDRISIRGYAQFRYNRLLETNDRLKCSTCDRSIGENGGFLLRRARLVITGDVGDRLSFGIQPDFSSEVGARENTLVLRQYYADIYLDRARTVRARIGQSSVPVGFEALQSSSRRGPLDRADAIDSSAPGEQDLGVFFYWTPPAARRRFRTLGDARHKGTADYGVLALGAYNGQGGNRAEMNDAPHVVARVAYPFRLPRGQFLELDAHAYTGTYTVGDQQRRVGVGGPADFSDRRAGASLILFPQPIGIDAEWTFGRGPEYEAATNSVVDRPQRGGYAMLSYVLHDGRQHRVLVYTRAQRFDGAFKTDPDARHSVMHEYEPGVEWTVEPGLEFTVAYAISDRHYQDSVAPDNQQRGRFVRLQAQFGF
jgi:hypothetical protein